MEQLLSRSTKTLNTSSGSQRTSRGTRLNIFQEIFLDLSGFKQLPLRKGSTKWNGTKVNKMN